MSATERSRKVAIALHDTFDDATTPRAPRDDAWLALPSTPGETESPDASRLCVNPVLGAQMSDVAPKSMQGGAVFFDSEKSRIKTYITKTHATSIDP